MAKCKVCKVKFDPRYFLQKTCIEPKCLAGWQKTERESKADKAHRKKKKEVQYTTVPGTGILIIGILFFFL